MALIYYNLEKNFGDELNEWLWPQILGEDILNNPDVAIIGIGTILFPGSYVEENAKKYQNKIVVGSGVRYIDRQIEIDSSWHISFVRGPISEYLLKKEGVGFITDSAYFIQFTDFFDEAKVRPKKYNISFMPHFKSVHKKNWQQICDKCGIHFISPISTEGVEKTMIEIAESNFLITEAMHGAIVADIFRVPWKRVRFYSHIFEGNIVSELKWIDWLKSIEMDYENTSNLYREKLWSNFFLGAGFHFRLFLDSSIVRKFKTISNSLNSFKKSDDKVFLQKSTELKLKIQELKDIILKC